jgi:hypothetical protein
MVVVMGTMQPLQFTVREAVGHCERVAPQDVEVLVAHR